MTNWLTIKMLLQKPKLTFSSRRNIPQKKWFVSTLRWLHFQQTLVMNGCHQKTYAERWQEELSNSIFCLLHYVWIVPFYWIFFGLHLNSNLSTIKTLKNWTCTRFKLKVSESKPNTAKKWKYTIGENSTVWECKS